MAHITSAVASAYLPWVSDATVHPADDDPLGSLADEITNRLFRAGLDLCSAMGLAKDEAVRVRLERAVEELDEAVKDLRHLVLALGEQDGPD